MPPKQRGPEARKRRRRRSLFYIGQSSDDVAEICRRTNRRARKVRVLTKAGQWYTFITKHGRQSEIEAEAEAQGLAATEPIREVVRYFAECTLHFTFGRITTPAPDGKGIQQFGDNCWRVSRVAPAEDES